MCAAARTLFRPTGCRPVHRRVRAACSCADFPETDTPGRSCAPGGGTDVLARLLSPELTKQFGQQIVIVNRAGGATMIGTEFVARSAPDGHTLVIATTPHAINPTLYKKVPFDPLKDFTMISQLGLTTTVLVVHPSLPVSNVKEFIALAKRGRGS
jgi:tripartite-type tricarboxylate transporter receptor subunit TctC